MTEVPDRSPCLPAAGRGLRNRGDRVRLSEAMARCPRPDARDHVLKELACGTAADPDDINRHSVHSTLTQSALKNAKSSPSKVPNDMADIMTEDSSGSVGDDGRNGKMGQRSHQITRGRGRGRRPAPDMSLVRSSSRRKIKKSLGPDFLDPTELSYQMKHKLPDVLKEVAEIEKVHHQERMMQCSQCNQKLPLAEDDCMLTDSLKRLKWICTPCRKAGSWDCCFCGHGEADFLCPSCEPPVCKSFHRKCIVELEPEPAHWMCKDCEEQVDAVAIPNGEKERSKSQEPCLAVSVDDSLVDDVEENVTSNSNELQSETRMETDDVVSDKAAMSSEGEKDAPLRNKKPETWTVADVVSFIESAGFKSEAIRFKDQEIDGKSLLLMKRSDVIMGLKLKVGPALKIFSFINHLQIFKLVTKETSAL